MNKFGNAPPKEFTIKKLEENLSAKFELDKESKDPRFIRGQLKEIKRFSHLTIHRLVTLEGYVEQKLNMIQRLENLNKKDKK
jgi:hypothetical protein